jgi:hypothetical protein
VKQFAKEQQKLVSNKEGNEEGNKEGRLWSHVLSRKGYSKVKPHIQAAFQKWILEHPDVVESPIPKDSSHLLQKT